MRLYSAVESVELLDEGTVRMHGISSPTISGDNLRFDLGAAPAHAERHVQTVGQRGLRSEAELLDSALRIADRHPHLAAARRTVTHDEFCSA
jgi:hypothetical protein